LPVTFGIGQADTWKSLKIHWPGGDTQEVTSGTVDRMIEITQ